MRNRHLFRNPITLKFLRKNKEKYLISQTTEGKEEDYNPFSEKRFNEIVRKAK